MDLRSIMLSEKPASKGLHLYRILEKRKAQGQQTCQRLPQVGMELTTRAQGKQWDSSFDCVGDWDCIDKTKTTLKMEKSSVFFA